MPALNFKQEFVNKILSGEKTTTIRKPSKRKFKIDGVLYLYTGQRSKDCTKLGTATVRRLSQIEIGAGEDVYINSVQINWNKQNTPAGGGANNTGSRSAGMLLIFS